MLIYKVSLDVINLKVVYFWAIKHVKPYFDYLITLYFIIIY